MLAVLAGDGADERCLDAAHFPPVYDVFRLEWERAAWSNAGAPAGEARAKLDLLRWRLHALVASLTGDLSDAYEAVHARPDLAVSRAALGLALCRAGHPAEAISHLRQALAANPWDRTSARALFGALGEAGRGAEQARLAEDRRLTAPEAVPPEGWFAGTAAPPGGRALPAGRAVAAGRADAAAPPPAVTELASVIVLCRGPLDHTRLCLESVLRHSRPPFEVVLLDDGLGDALAALAGEVRRDGGAARTEVLRKAGTQGFPEGCLEALASVRGRFVVFLDGATVVTEGWLGRLVKCVLHQWPRVGMAGPVSNGPGEQGIAADFEDLSGLPAFAARRLREQRGRAADVRRLDGPCLVARREVLDRIGASSAGEPAVPSGDLSLRVRQAGFRLLAALDVYVHRLGECPSPASRKMVGPGPTGRRA